MIQILKEYTDTIQLYSDDIDKQIQYLNELSEFCKLQKTRINGKLTPEQVLNEVCYINKIPIEHLKSKLKNGDLVKARQDFFYLMVRFYIRIPKPLITLEKTGKLVNRSHGTVWHGYNRVNGYREFDKIFNSQFIDKYSHLFVY